MCVGDCGKVKDVGRRGKDEDGDEREGGRGEMKPIVWDLKCEFGSVGVFTRGVKGDGSVFLTLIIVADEGLA